MKITVKPLTKNNIKQAIDIAVEATVGERPDITKDMNKNLKEKANRYFVAYDGDEMVGEIGWYQDKDGFAKNALGVDFPEEENIYWVAYFAVKSERRGKGIGSILMNKIESEVRSKNGKYLWVFTLRARLFYEKFGFKFIKKGYIENCWENFLRKDLQGPSS